MTRRLSSLNFASLLLAGLTLIPAAQAQQTPRHYTTKFEVSITKRASALLPPYQVIGELAMDVAADGTFTCEITPLQDPNALDVPESVLVMAGKFVADGPKKLPCVGQVTGRLIGISIDMGDNYKIYGTGVLPFDLSRFPSGSINMAFGGSASTSVAGEGGDWATVCVTVQLVNPITGTVYAQRTVCVTVTVTLN
jgi:hypothetical protein